MNNSKQTEALKLAQEWYDSGNENPDDFANMIKQVITLAEQTAQQEPHVHAISGKTTDELWLETGRLRSELADLKAQQEPVYLVWMKAHCAWMHTDKDGFDKTDPEERWMLYTSPPARSHDALISRLCNARMMAFDRLPKQDVEAIDDAIAALVEQQSSSLNPLWVATHPDSLTTLQPNKPWVELTDEDIGRCFDAADGTMGSLISALADKLREKNAAPCKPLTDEQIEREWQFLHDEEGNPPDHYDFARAIEAAHGIKE